MKARWIIALAVGLLVPGMTQAPEIKLLGSGALKEAYLELLPQFEQASGHKVAAQWLSTPEVHKRIASGEAADLVILADNATQELMQQGKLAPGNRISFARSGIGVAVRAGALKPDIGSPDALKRSLLAAKSVGYSAGASGIYLLGMFEKLGIADQVKAKAALVKPGERVGEVVARGEAEIGFQQVSELMHVNGVDYLGPLPPELQHITVFSGGIPSAAKEADAAAALAQFLTALAVTPTLKKYGLERG
jgi:molybdate transport system substrate-binding protein